MALVGEERRGLEAIAEDARALARDLLPEILRLCRQLKSEATKGETMGQEYRLVSEEEWENLRAEVKSLRKSLANESGITESWQIRSEHYERKLRQALGELEDRKKDVLFWQSEAERARLETENLTNDLFNLRWQYSHVDPNADDPSGFNECRCDHDPEKSWPEKPIREVETRFYVNGERVPLASDPKPAGRWTSDREWESDPEPCADEQMNPACQCDRCREAFTDPEPCDGCAGCSCAEDERDRRIANAVADELMERLRAFVL